MDFTEWTETRKRRGLASCPPNVRQRVAQSGGNAPHRSRGLQGVSQEARAAIAKKGGLARGLQIKQRKSASKSSEDSMKVPMIV